MDEKLDGAEDCVKLSILILESLTAQNVEPQNQIRVAEGMLRILRTSYPDEKLYNEERNHIAIEMEEEIRRLMGEV